MEISGSNIFTASSRPPKPTSRIAKSILFSQKILTAAKVVISKYVSGSFFLFLSMKLIALEISWSPQGI